MPSVKHADVRAHLEKWVASAAAAGLNEAGDPVKLSGAVMAGAVLAQHDAATTGKLQPATRQALELMWRVQQADGGFQLGHGAGRSAVGNRPALWAHDGGDRRRSGAGRLRRHAQRRAGLEKLRAHLGAHPPEHSHQRAMLLLADHGIGGLLTEEARRQTVADLFALQRPDGGWAMASLGNATWKCKDGAPQDLTTSDGYGTGFCVYVLRVAGHVPADDARIRPAVTWLKTHQRAGGYWYTRSPKNSDELSSYVGTAYAVLALRPAGNPLTIRQVTCLHGGVDVTRRSPNGTAGRGHRAARGATIFGRLRDLETPAPNDSRG